jgi:hypothetical protein
MIDSTGSGQLVGFQSREGSDGWYTSLSIVVRTDAPPDIATLSRWLSQVTRNTNTKLGSSPVPIPRPRPRLAAPAAVQPAT